VRTPAGTLFLDRLLKEEVIPFLALPKAELETFAEAVLRRFSNPFLQHQWYDISLNGLVKYQARNLPRLLAYSERFGKPAPLMTLSLAAWLVFYLGRYPGAASLPPRDAADILAKVKAIGALDDGTAAGREKMIAAYLSESAFWGASIDTPALRQAVTADFTKLSTSVVSIATLGALIVAQSPN
jgi:tagaturonate reductase